MGRDKAALRSGGQTMLAHIRHTAKKMNLPVRVIRRDLVARCGPLGGIYTALKTTCADAVLFLACDMPNVSKPFLKKLLSHFGARRRGVFTWSEPQARRPKPTECAGFPFLLRSNALLAVETLLAEKKFSLQALAEKTKAKKFRPSFTFKSDLLNVNTPADWMEVKKKIPRKK